MRLAIVLVLFCATASAQETSTYDYRPMKGRGVYYADLILRDSLLSWWDAYKAECWGDSVKHDRLNEGFAFGDVYGVSTIDGSPLDSTEVWAWSYETLFSKPRFYWSHRTPTLDGFMEWLRRKP